jgi:predicted transposase/invertase (TIGR01784 family)
MVQWRKLKEKDVHNNPLHRWLVSFDKNSPPDLIEEVVGMDSAIMAANEKMNYVLSDDEESEHYWKRELARMDKRAELKFAHDQGVEQGTIEVARNFKKMGLSIEQIASGTGLSFEEIENLS